MLPAEKSAYSPLRIIAVVPAYNEEAAIGKVIENVRRYVTDIIVVDDGSTDRTGEIALSFGSTVIRNSRNRGKGFALRKGFIECMKHNPDVVITLDADGQHDPDDIPRVVQPISEKIAEVVIGSRYFPGSKIEAPLIRRVGLGIINRLDRYLINSSVRDSQSGFRAYTREVLNLLTKYPSSGYGAEVEQLGAIQLHGFKVAEVPITMHYKGLAKTSKKNFIVHGMNIVSTIFRLAVEGRPLTIFGISGIAMILAFAFSSSYLIYYFNETRYFSLPLALLAMGLGVMGSMLLLISFVFYALNRIKEREDIIARTVLDLINKDKYSR